MITITSLLTVICVSVDGFCLGYALGMSKFKMRFYMFIMMGLIASVLSQLAMDIGNIFFGVISERSCETLCAVILFILAYIASSNENIHIKSNAFTVTLLAGLGVAIDASLAAFVLAMGGYSHPVYPLLLGIFHFLFSYMGYIFSHTMFSRILKDKIPGVSAIILCVLALIRLI